MDFTFVEKIENEGICYKLLRSNFCKGYYVIIAQGKRDFSCFWRRGRAHGAVAEREGVGVVQRPAVDPRRQLRSVRLRELR